MNDQKVFKFENSNFYFEEDFCISNSNKKVYDFLNLYPKWSSKLINIHGLKLSGKSHMVNIFKNKLKSTIIDYELLKKTKNIENINQYKSLLSAMENKPIDPINKPILITLIPPYLSIKTPTCTEVKT